MLREESSLFEKMCVSCSFDSIPTDRVQLPPFVILKEETIHVRFVVTKEIYQRGIDDMIWKHSRSCHL